MSETYLSRHMSVRTDWDKAWTLNHLYLALNNQELHEVRDRADGLFNAAICRGMVIG